MTTYFNSGATVGTDGYITLMQMYAASTLAARYDPCMAYKYARMPLDEQLNTIKRGDRVNIEMDPEMTVGSVTAATGAVTVNAPYFVQKSVVFDQWKDVTIGQTRQAGVQQSQDAIKKLAADQIKALQEDANEFFVGKFDDYLTTHTLGVGGSIAPSASALNEAIKMLRSENLDPDNKHAREMVFVLPAEAADILAEDEKFYSNDKTGKMGGAFMSPITTYRNIPVIFTNGCATVSSNKVGALFHRDALLFGVQFMDGFREKVNLAYSDVLSAAWLYGAGAGKIELGVRLDFRV